MVHNKESAISKLIGNTEDEVDFVNHKEFKLLRMIHNIYFGNEVKDQLPIACNYDFFTSIDFKKGCYLGQETSARQYFTGNHNIRYCSEKTHFICCFEETNSSIGRICKY